MNNLDTGNELETNENENLSTAIKSIFVNGYSNASREFERFCTFWGFIDRPRNNMDGFTFRESGHIPLDQSTTATTNDDVNQINQQNSFSLSRSYNNNYFQQTNNHDNDNSEGTIYERVIPDTYRYQGRQQKRSTSSLLENNINIDIGSSLSSSPSNKNNNNNDHLTKRTKYTYDSYSSNLSTKNDDDDNNNEDTSLYLNYNNRKRPLEIDTIKNDNNDSFDQNNSSRYKKLKLTESLDTDSNTTPYSNIQSLTNRNTPPILSSSHLPFNEDNTMAKYDGYDLDHDRLRKDRQDKLSTFSSIHPTPHYIHASPILQNKHTLRQYNFNNGGGRRVSTSSSLMTSSSASHLLFLEEERLARLEQEVHTLQSQVHKFKDSPFILQQQHDNYSPLKKGRDINHSTQPPSPISLTKSSKYQWPPSTDTGKTPIKANAIRRSIDTAVTPTYPVNISKQSQLPQQKTSISTPLHTSPSKGAVHIPITSPIKKRATLITTNDNDDNDDNDGSDGNGNNDDDNDNNKKQVLPEKKQVISSPPSMYRTPNPINFTPSRMSAATATTNFVQKTPLPTLNIISSSSSPTSASFTIKPISPSSPTPSTSSTTTTTSFIVNQPRPKLDLNEIRNHRLVQKQKITTKESPSTSASMSTPSSTSIEEKIASHRQLPVSKPALPSTHSGSTLKRIDSNEKHKDTMNKIIHQIPKVKLRKTDMIRGPDGNMYRNPIWHEIYKNGK
ncbi:hypothetical protein BJ944DRAFT_266950 [Cunninghamella echinulata]|nr:hypothetical protein BJ944DRAFT_266950 [Cunninghamella echinulata]